MVKKGLGRGLDILIPHTDLNETFMASDVLPANEGTISFLPTSQIIPNSRQPRRGFAPDKLAELVASIREKGIIQPILVHELDGQYEIIAGERRWRAAVELGLPRIPTIIKDVSDVELIELSLVENIQREDLNPLEEACAYQQLITEFNFRQEDLAVKVGKDRSSIGNKLRLLKLPGEIQEALMNNIISMGHARALLAMPTTESMLKLAHQVIKDGLSVRETERIVKDRAGFVKIKTEKKAAVIKQDKSTFLKDIEEKLKERLGTQVLIKKSKKRQIIEIEYYTDEDLERILGILI